MGVSVLHVLAGAFVLLSASVVVVGALGLLAFRDPFNRLHFVGLVSALAPVLLTVGILFQETVSRATVKSFIVTLVLLIGGPILSHATARAARVRQAGHWEAFPHEIVSKR